MKQKLLVVLLALMVIFACSACSVDEQAPDEPGDITGITLTEVGILSWNAYKGANSYRLVIGMNSMVYSEPSCNLNEFECAELSNILKPRITIPCHYGMFAGHGGNVGIFYKVMQEKYPNNDFIVMCQGEKISL